MWYSISQVFDWICEPVVSFLQGRSDTVKCVVAAMLEGSENGWDEETLKGAFFGGRSIVYIFYAIIALAY